MPLPKSIEISTNVLAATMGATLCGAAGALAGAGLFADTKIFVEEVAALTARFQLKH